MPRLWRDDDHINAVAALSLRMLASEYMFFLQTIGLPLDSAGVSDIVIFGSAADYYWDADSDIDLCIVCDLGAVRRMLAAYGKKWHTVSKKYFRYWRAGFEISVFGRNVDISFADINDPFPDGFHQVGGYFSVVNNEWVRRPRRLTRGQLALVRKNGRMRYRVIRAAARALVRGGADAATIERYLANLKSWRSRSVCFFPAQPITSTNVAYKYAKQKHILQDLRVYQWRARSKQFCGD